MCFFYFLALKLESSIPKNIRKIFFWKEIFNIFRVGTRKFHSLIYKEKYFLEKYQKFFRIGFFLFQACCWKLSQIALHISTFCFYVKRSNWNQECKAADILLFSISQNPDIFYFSNKPFTVFANIKLNRSLQSSLSCFSFVLLPLLWV